MHQRDLLRRMTFAAALLSALFGCDSEDLPGVAVTCACQCNMCVAGDPPLATTCSGPESVPGGPVTACIPKGDKDPTAGKRACDKACGDAAARYYICIPPCLPYFSHIETCRALGSFQSPTPRACMTSGGQVPAAAVSATTLGFASASGTVAIIDSSRSVGRLSFGEDLGEFVPTGTIVLGGGFCAGSGCPAALENVVVQAQSGFDVGSHRVDRLDVLSNGPVDAVENEGRIVVPGTSLFAATVTLGGSDHSRAATPGFLSGTLDNARRELALTGEVDLDQGSASFLVVARLGDSPPVAVIDVPQTVECGDPIALSAGRSFDPDGQPISSFEWSLLGETTSTPLGTGATLPVQLPVGDHRIKLYVRNPHGSAVAYGAVRVQDTLPPRIESIAAAPQCLWNPDHALVRYDLGRDLTVTVKDSCDPKPTVRLIGIESSQPDDALGDGHTTGDIRMGTDAFCLRRERSGTTQADRDYTVDVEVSDAAGHRSRASTVISVSHDQRDGRCEPPPAERVIGDDLDPRCVFPPPGERGPAANGCSSSGAGPGPALALVGALALLARRRRRFRALAIAVAIGGLGCSVQDRRGDLPFPECATGWWTSHLGACDVAVQCMAPAGDAAQVCTQPDCRSFGLTGYLDPGPGKGPYLRGHALWSAQARLLVPDHVSTGEWTPLPPDQAAVSIEGVSTTVQAQCTSSGLDDGGGGLLWLQEAALQSALDSAQASGSWATIRY